MARKGKKLDVPEDYIPPEPPVALDTFQDKMDELRRLLAIVPPKDKFAAKDSPALRANILLILSAGHTFKMAANTCGIDVATLKVWRTNDDGSLSDFGVKCEEAYEEGADTFEQEFVRRAREGVVRPVFQGGVLVGHERVFSDSLMQMLMAGRRSRVYGKQKVEMSGPDGAPVAHVHKMEIEFVKAKKTKGDDE